MPSRSYPQLFTAPQKYLQLNSGTSPYCWEASVVFLCLLLPCPWASQVALVVKNLGSIPGLGRSPEGEHGNPLRYSSLENLMARGAWQATVHRVAKSQTWLKGLSMHACTVLRGKWAAFCLMLFKLFMMCYIDLKGPPVTSMAPHSSTVAWKIPWMEDPGRLQSMGSLWVGHDWATSLSLSLIWNDHL